MRVAVGLVMAGVFAVVGSAQVRRGGQRRSRVPPRFKPADHRENGFSCWRLIYTSVRSEREGYGWSTDCPAADQTFMIRLSELPSTKAPHVFERFAPDGNSLGVNVLLHVMSH